MDTGKQEIDGGRGMVLYYRVYMQVDIKGA